MDVAASSSYQQQQQQQHHHHQRNTPPRAYTSSPPSSPLSPPNADLPPPPTLLNHGQGASAVPSTTATATAPVKKPRKKREPATNEDGTVKEKKPRKPREPRDPNAPPKKRAKTAATSDASSSGPANGRTSTPGLSVFRSNPPSVEKPIIYQPPGAVNGSTAAAPTTMSRSSSSGAPSSQRPAPIVYLSNNNSPSSSSASLNFQPQQPHRPPSSGQRYDPIRESSAYRPPPPPPAAASRPSGMSISSMLDGGASYPPNSPSRPTANSTPHPPASSLNGSTHPSPLSKSVEVNRQPVLATKPATTAMDIDIKPAPPSSSATAAEPKLTLTNGRPPSPKEAISAPGRKKESPPPPPRGSGLLSAASFNITKFTADNQGNTTTPKEYAEVPNQCIVIEVPMVKETGNYVNFLKEVEQKYGFDVAHPRLAEHRRRMRDMAAAGAELENGIVSGDEMSLDNSEDDTDVEMGEHDDERGTADETAAAGGNASATAGNARKPRKARKKEDYDKNDDFIDDTELMWEEQALASVDGYFVWSGPLQPESEKKDTSKTSERGGALPRRGRGSRGGRMPGQSTRGSRKEGGTGRGGRGGTTAGNTVKKPRLKKAEREALEREKAEREKMAGGSMPVDTPASFS